MILTYEAVDTGGHRTSDKVEALDAQEAVEQLRRRGLYVTRIADTPDRAAGPVTAGGRTAATRLPLKTLAIFTRQMTMLLRAGSGVVPSLAAIKRQMDKPKHVALFKKIIGDVEDGMALTDALRRHPRAFDPVYCAVVAAGEASATLDEMFDRLSGIVGKQRLIRNKVLGALTYPALLTLMSCGIFLVLLFFVLPRFNAMFVQLHVDAPASTRTMLATADFFVTYWPVVIGAAAALATGGVYLLMSRPGRQWISNMQTRIPVVGRIRSRLIQAQVFRTVGTLLQSGVGVLDTVGLTRESTRNRQYQRLFDGLEHAVASGGTLSAAYEESGLIEPSICQAIHTGEESGNLGGAIIYCADVLDETNTELINALMKLVEPVILIGMGLVVGLVAVSLFLPLFDLTAALQ